MYTFCKITISFFGLKFVFCKKATKIDRHFDGEDFVNFCALLRKLELYMSASEKEQPVLDLRFSFLLQISLRMSSIQFIYELKSDHDWSLGA